MADPVVGNREVEATAGQAKGARMDRDASLRDILDLLRSGEEKKIRRALALVAREHVVEARSALLDFLHGLPAGALRDAVAGTLAVLDAGGRSGARHGASQRPPEGAVPSRDGFSSSDVHVRLDAVIEATVTKDRGAADALVALARSEREPQVRRMLAKALERVLGRDAFWIIVEHLLGDGDPEVRITAVEALEELHALRACPFFFRMLLDPSEKVVAHVKGALNRFGRADLLRAAEVGSKLKDPSIRRAVALALADMGEVASRAVVDRLLGDEDPEVREAAALARARLDEAGGG